MAAKDRLMELGASTSTPRELNLSNPNAGFLADVSKAERKITQLIETTKTIQSVHYDILNLKATSPQELKKKKEQADKMTQDSRTQVKEIDSMVRSLLANTEHDNPEISRVRHSAARAVSEKFQKAVQGFQDMQEQCKENYRDQVRRQAQALKHDSKEVTDSELDDMMKKGKSAFQQQLQETNLEERLNEIKEKRIEIQKIEQSMVEIVEMMQQVAKLVHEQDAMIDDIESNISAANSHVQSANTQLVKAAEKQKSNRRMTCCLIIIVLIILLFFLSGIIF
jgi:t-SNARE complex subunit (syntaxin)